MAEVLAARNVSVYLYNYEYKSVFDQWDGEYFMFIIITLNISLCLISWTESIMSVYMYNYEY